MSSDADSDAYMTSAVDATLALLEERAKAIELETASRTARQRLQQLRRERDTAIWHLYHDCGLTGPVIARQVGDLLKARGLSDEDVARLGVSHDTVRRVAGSRKAPAELPKEEA